MCSLIPFSTGINIILVIDILLGLVLAATSIKDEGCWPAVGIFFGTIIYAIVYEVIAAIFILPLFAIIFC